ncbi:MAG: carboxypeptidase-like regulatory domain-containing protein [bacterium]
MGRKLAWLTAWLVFGVIANLAMSQTNERVVITGRVVDDHRMPLKNASVFLAHTMLHDSTNRSGNFRIENVPVGTYDLVISMPGFRMRTLVVKVNTGRRNQYNLRLKKKAQKKSAIMPATRDTKKWQKNVDRFKKIFFSTTANSRSCQILNPQVLYFPEDKSAVFQAAADEPIIFENKALGYRVTYHLQEFEVGVNYTKYHGNPEFEELTAKDDEEKLQWRLNRLKAFLGSPAHFFAAIYRNYKEKAKDNAVLKKEGFLVSMLMDLRNQADEAYRVPTGSHAQYREIDVNDYVQPGDNDFEFGLSFPHFWEIIYTEEFEEEEYLWYQGFNPNRRQRYRRSNPAGVSGERRGRTSGNVGDQKSRIKLTGNVLTISTTTNHYDVLGLQVYDYWSWQGMADIIPRDYTLAVAKAEQIALAGLANVEN